MEEQASETKQDTRSNNEITMYEMIQNDDFEECQRLLTESDVRIDCLDKNGMTPLQNAAFKGNLRLVNLFLDHGANVNSLEHDSGYTTLMFAALSGSKEVTQRVLEAGAKTYHTNKVNRTATQMAAFVGQHQCVSLINNFISLEDIEYYTKTTGLEKQPKLAPELAYPLYKMMLISNIHPVKLSLYLNENMSLLKNSQSICRVLHILVTKNMEPHNTNEVLAVKFNYYSTLLKEAATFCGASLDNCEKWIKYLLKGRDSDGYPENIDRLVRASLKEFPKECQLIVQSVRTLAPVKIGDKPTSLSVLSSGINGQKFLSDEEIMCDTCGELSKDAKQCSSCKMVNYCNQRCQKLHWSTHKKWCKELAIEYKEMKEFNAKSVKEVSNDSHDMGNDISNS